MWTGTFLMENSTQLTLHPQLLSYNNTRIKSQAYKCRSEEAVIHYNVDLLKSSDSLSYSYSFYNGQLNNSKRFLFLLICPFSPSAVHGDGPFFTSELCSFYDKCWNVIIANNTRNTHLNFKKPCSFK